MELDFKEYKRKAIAEIAEWVPGTDMKGISVNVMDAGKGSPMQGDKIARNPADHDDKWLIAEKYFQENFEQA